MKSEFAAIVVGAVVLAMSVGVLLLLNRLLKQVDGATFIAVLLVPLIVYAVASGRLAEFSGPGGWGAKFRDEAKAGVQGVGLVENTTTLEVQELQPVEKGGVSQLQEFTRNLRRDQPNALMLRVGRGGYAPNAILQYLTQLSALGPSTHVVFIHYNDGQFVGSATASQVAALLANRQTEEEFMNELLLGGPEAFGDFDFLVRESLTPEDTNEKALQKFSETNAQALVVLSANGRTPIGIVDRNRLMTQLMVKLANGQ